jgi:hypothetical protein
MPHRLRAGDTDEHVVQERAEVRSKWAKIDRFLERFGRLLLAVAVTISTWFMAHVVAPLKEVPGLVAAQAHTDTVMARRGAKTDSMFAIVNYKLDQAGVDRGKMVDILAALAGLECDTFTIREKRTSKLCGRLLNGELP